MQDDLQSKAALRQHLRAQRQALDHVQVGLCSQAIARRLGELASVKSAVTVAAYLAMDHEVDLLAPLLFQPVLSGTVAHVLAGKELYLPVVRGKELGFVPYGRGEPLQVGRYGILEPALCHENYLTGLAITRLDVILLPLVGFDRQGVRLGYGGGYFDRLLSPWNGALQGEKGVAQEKKPTLIGLAYSFQEVPLLPRQVHDYCLDYVVTEGAIHAFDGHLSGNQRFPVQ